MFHFKAIYVALLGLSIGGSMTSNLVYGQETSSEINVDPCLDRKGNDYIDRQDEAFLDEINKTLLQFPPQYPEPRERYLGLLLLDAVMHDKYAAFRIPVEHFYRQRMEEALDQIEHTHIEGGATIWKLYNMGYIIRTSTVTLAFDLVDGQTARAENFTLSQDLMDRLVDQCDVLFISHRHIDHAEENIARAFFDQGKPVVAPPQVWADQDIYQKITHLKREANTEQSLAIQKGKYTLKVIVYPGHQMGSIENNVPLVFTPEGLSFCHMGDQINEGDFMVDYDWIDDVKEHYQVDVLMPPCWTNEIYRIVQGFDPKLVLPGHQNELGHPVDDRVPYWGDADFLQLTYPQLKRSAYKVVVMTWGEAYHYFPGN